MHCSRGVRGIPQLSGHLGIVEFAGDEMEGPLVGYRDILSSYV
jgi:hypothetical protein